MAICRHGARDRFAGGLGGCIVSGPIDPTTAPIDRVIPLEGRYEVGVLADHPIAASPEVPTSGIVRKIDAYFYEWVPDDRQLERITFVVAPASRGDRILAASEISGEDATALFILTPQPDGALILALPIIPMDTRVAPDVAGLFGQNGLSHRREGAFILLSGSADVGVLAQVALDDRYVAAHPPMEMAILRRLPVADAMPDAEISLHRRLAESYASSGANYQEDAHLTQRQVALLERYHRAGGRPMPRDITATLARQAAHMVEVAAQMASLAEQYRSTVGILPALSQASPEYDRVKSMLDSYRSEQQRLRQDYSNLSDEIERMIAPYYPENTAPN